MKWYARNGDEITIEQASALLVNLDYKIIEQTQVGPYWVSTVWLGLDHGFLPDLPPLIFETMVFAHDHEDPAAKTLGPEMDCQRYTTEEQARAGHEEFVTLVRATLQERPEDSENFDREG